MACSMEFTGSRINRVSALLNLHRKIRSVTLLLLRGVILFFLIAHRVFGEPDGFTVCSL